MIERAVRKQEELKAYMALEESSINGLPPTDRLTGSDWKLLSEVMNILKPIHELKMRTQGSGAGGRLWDILIGMEYLSEHLADWRQQYKPITAEITLESTAQKPSTPLGPDGVIQASPAPRARPARSCNLPTYLKDYELGPPSRQAARHHPNRQAARCYQQFNEAALPKHSRNEYTLPRPHDISERDQIEALERRYIAAAIESTWSKLNDYYTRLVDSPLFAASVILHPGYNLQWLEQLWGRTEKELRWFRDAKHGLKAYLDRWYDDNIDNPLEISALRPVRTMKPKITKHEPGYYDGWIQSRRAFFQKTGGELERYFALGPQNTDNPIQWWLDRKVEFPRLSCLALDILAIPPMAADCERTFSLAKLTISSQRQSVQPETLEGLQCMKNWLRRGLIRLGNALVHEGQ